MFSKDAIKDIYYTILKYKHNIKLTKFGYKFLLYWENGKIYKELNYNTNGILHGKSRCWKQNGKLLWSNEYINGRVV